MAFIIGNIHMDTATNRDKHIKTPAESLDRGKFHGNNNVSSRHKKCQHVGIWKDSSIHCERCKDGDARCKIYRYFRSKFDISKTHRRGVMQTPSQLGFLAIFFTVKCIPTSILQLAIGRQISAFILRRELAGGHPMPSGSYQGT